MALIGGKESFGEFSLGEAFAVGLAKSVSERVLARTPVGNGTLMSGAVKLAGSAGLGMFWKNRIGKTLATAWAVDGVEDVINGLLGGGALGSPQAGAI